MPTISEPIAFATVVAGTFAGAVIDLRTRRVPNVLTIALSAAGILLAVTGASGLTVSRALAGFALGFALMLPGHLLGATGAGDVKLMAAVGTLIGPGRVVTAFLDMAIAGGVIALVVATRRQRLAETIGGATRLVATRAASAAEIESPAVNNRFAYAPAIAIGALVAALRW